MSKSSRLAAIAIAASIVVVYVAAYLLQPDVPDPSAITRILGRFHILALHVPIGIVVLALIGEAATLHPKLRERGDVVVTFSMPLVILTAFAAIILGLMLAHSSEYSKKILLLHRSLAIIGFTLAGTTTIVLPYRERAGRFIHRGLLGASGLALGVGAHFGGSLTHGSDFLFPAAPPKVTAEEPDAGAATAEDAGAIEDAGVVADASVPEALDASTDAAAPAVVDAGKPAAPKLSPKASAQAILVRRCAPCHTTNAKGGLRVTDLSNLKAGSAVAGQPGSSKIYARIVLPKDDDDHMPPVNKPQLSAGEVAAIKAWIVDMKTGQ